MYRSAMQSATARLAGVFLASFYLLSAAPPNKADLSNLVVVGDSLSAGFQNFSLLDRQQVHSYANVIATQARVPMVLPLVPFPGVPNALQLIDPGPPPIVQPMPGTLPPIPRTNPTEQPTNLAVPGMNVADALNKRPSPIINTAVDALTNIVLGFPSPFIVPGLPMSQVEQALALKPTTVIVWVGSNDVLMPAITGSFALLTPVSTFGASYKAVLDAFAGTRTVITANVPNVLQTPYFTPAAVVAAQAHLPLDLIGPKLGIKDGDYVRPGALPFIQAILTGQIPGPLPALCPASIPGLPVTQVPCIVTSADADAFRAATDAYNQIIADQAAAHGAVVVDIHALVDKIHDKGYVVGGQRLTTDYLGGLFSLDAIHPSNTGYAIIANEFIKTMNRNVAAGIPPVSIEQVRKDDPLVFESKSHSASSQ